MRSNDKSGGSNEELTESASHVLTSSSVKDDVKTLLSMCVGTLFPEEMIPWEMPPFKSSRQHFLPSNDHFQGEILMSAQLLCISPMPQPRAWTKKQLLEKLHSPAYGSASDVDKKILASKFGAAKAMAHEELKNSEATEGDATTKGKMWATNIPWLRFYHVLVCDDLRYHFTHHDDVYDCWYELDGRKSSGNQATFWELAANKFNNDEFIPQNYAVPHLHSDFLESINLEKGGYTADAESLRGRFLFARAHLTKVNIVAIN